MKYAVETVVWHVYAVIAFSDSRSPIVSPREQYSSDTGLSFHGCGSSRLLRRSGRDTTSHDRPGFSHLFGDAGSSYISVCLSVPALRAGRGIFSGAQGLGWGLRVQAMRATAATRSPLPAAHVGLGRSVRDGPRPGSVQQLSLWRAGGGRDLLLHGAQGERSRVPRLHRPRGGLLTTPLARANSPQWLRRLLLSSLLQSLRLPHVAPCPLPGNCDVVDLRNSRDVTEGQQAQRQRGCARVTLAEHAQDQVSTEDRSATPGSPINSDRRKVKRSLDAII